MNRPIRTMLSWVKKHSIPAEFRMTVASGASGQVSEALNPYLPFDPFHGSGRLIHGDGQSPASDFCLPCLPSCMAASFAIFSGSSVMAGRVEPVAAALDSRSEAMTRNHSQQCRCLHAEVVQTAAGGCA